jgi:hypothetical protein
MNPVKKFATHMSKNSQFSSGLLKGTQNPFGPKLPTPPKVTTSKAMQLAKSAGLTNPAVAGVLVGAAAVGAILIAARRARQKALQDAKNGKPADPYRRDPRPYILKQLTYGPYVELKKLIQYSQKHKIPVEPEPLLKIVNQIHAYLQAIKAAFRNGSYTQKKMDPEVKALDQFVQKLIRHLNKNVNGYVYKNISELKTDINSLKTQFNKFNSSTKSYGHSLKIKRTPPGPMGVFPINLTRQKWEMKPFDELIKLFPSAQAAASVGSQAA